MNPRPSPRRNHLPAFTFFLTLAMLAFAFADRSSRLAVGASTVASLGAQAQAQVQTPVTPAASAEPASDFGPTADERNTVAVAGRFGPSTAALSVVVDGRRMLPPQLESVSDAELAQLGVEIPTQRSSGSGFLVDVDGSPFVVSNFHVVEATLVSESSDMLEGATISATFPDHGEDVALEVVGVNPSFDLALLRAVDPANPLPPAPAIPIADSDLVLPGQKTIAFGNPFGLGATVTSGIVSSTGRFVPSIGDVAVPMIQTDAAINPGNSGGPLLNSSGELIGINTAIFNPEARSFAGVGFAVPSNLLREALANLELGGVSNISDTRPSFGASLGTLSRLPDIVREEAGLPKAGVAVLAVAAGGPAEAAGLRAPEFVRVRGFNVPVDPDIILAVDGDPVASAEDLNRAITYGSNIGQEVTLTVSRSGFEQQITVTLGGG